MPKIVDHEQKRKGILEICFPLFAKKGYAAVSMRELAKATNMSTGSLYHYFPTKKDLFFHMFSAKTKQDTLRFRDFLQGQQDGEKAILLLQFVRENDTYFQQVLLLALEFNRSVPQEEGNNFITELVAQYVKGIEQVLNFEKGTYGKPLFTYMAGIILQRTLGVVEDGFEAHTNFLHSLLTS